MRAILGSKRGFTLIELMVTLGIVALLALVGASTVMNTSGWLSRQRLKSAARELSMNMQYAKMEAIKRNTLCTIVFKQAIDGVTYDYVVFAEKTRDLVYDSGTESGSNVLKMVNFDNRNVTLDVSKGGGDGISFVANSDGLSAVGFHPTGMPRTGDEDTRGGGAVFLKDDFGNTMSVAINFAGRISIK